MTHNFFLTNYIKGRQLLSLETQLICLFENCVGAKTRDTCGPLLNIQEFTLCSPKKSACYTAVSRNITVCSASCTGLYADVQFTEDRIISPGTIGEAVQALRSELRGEIQVLAAAGDQIKCLIFEIITNKHNLIQYPSPNQ